jgi:hypothetical protein
MVADVGERAQYVDHRMKEEEEGDKFAPLPRSCLPANVC